MFRLVIQKTIAIHRSNFLLFQSHGRLLIAFANSFYPQIVSEYDQEIPQLQTADKPVAPFGRTTQQSRDTRIETKQSTQLSLPHQVDCKPGKKV